MEPPRFRINKKIPRCPSSPPGPVLHSPTRKITVKEQKEWKVQPCISNWKNAKGYTIPLDKRFAADGRGLQHVHINEKFAKMAEALYIADRKAREVVEARAQLEKKLAQKEREKKEDMLRQMAQRAREERAGIHHPSEMPEDKLVAVAEAPLPNSASVKKSTPNAIANEPATATWLVLLPTNARNSNAHASVTFPNRSPSDCRPRATSPTKPNSTNSSSTPPRAWTPDTAMTKRETGTLGSHLYRRTKGVDLDQRAAFRAG